MRIQSKLILFVFVVIALTSGIFSYLLLNTQIDTVMRGVDQKLLTAARMARDIVPDDYHDRISNRLSISTEEYAAIVDEYNQVCKDLELQYIWSLIQLGDNAYFTTATSPDHDISNGKHANFFDAHTNPETYAAAFASSQPVYSEFEDVWGRGKMVLLPYTDAHGRRFVYGASMSLEFMNAKVRKTILSSVGITGIALVVGLVVIYLLSVTLSRPLSRMALFAEELAQKGAGDTIDVKGSTELESLSKSFNSMSKAMARREQDLERERRRLFAFMNNAPAMIFVKDAKGRYLIVNDEFERIHGRPRSEILRKTAPELMGEKGEIILQNDMRALQSGQPLEVEEMFEINGENVTMFSTKFLLQEEGKSPLLCGISIDITNRKSIEEQLRLTSQAMDTVSEAIIVTDAAGYIIDANPAFTEITGYAREDAIGQTPSIGQSGRHDADFYKDMWGHLVDEGHWEGEIWDRRASGEVYPKWLSISSIQDALGNTTHYVGIFQDISQQKASEETLHQLAFYDPLTGLPNRTLFQERLSAQIQIAARRGSKVGLLFIDLDRFKYVNDSLGHTMGDKLLKLVAKRLSDMTRDNDTVARLGGDEFTIIIPDVDHVVTVQSLAQEALETISQPYLLDGRNIFLDASIGIVMYPHDAETSEKLIQSADLAMYKAKGLGRGKYAFFQPELTSASSMRLALESDLRQAVENEEFEVYYQPKVEITSRKVSGMEALVRWNHPTKGLISPAEFIPIAEDTGLILPIGEFVLRQACSWAKELREKGFNHLRVAVNLSALQFDDPKLVGTVAEVLENTGLESSDLELEITESLIMNDADRAVRVIQELADMGVHTSIDDFGTGYSSLSYLKKFTLNSLKIDRSFVKDIEVDSDDRAIVQAVASLAKNLNLCIVAEGVETEAQLEFLRGTYCHYIQGYYFSPPLPEDKFEEYITSCGVSSEPICLADDQL